MKQRKWITGAVALSAVVAALTGCANKQAGNVGDQTERLRTTRVTDPTYRQTNRQAYPNVPRSRYDAVDDNTTRLNNSITNNTQINDPTGRTVRLADHIAKEVARMREVRSASALVMGRSAYLAVVLENGWGDGEISQRLNRLISARVRKADPAIRRVYVSQNPNFVKQMNNYAQDLRQGRPVRGFIDQFSDIIRRTFPEAR